MLRIQPFWPAKHSQIYPLLAKLEQEDYISVELVPQRDKPDKKSIFPDRQGQGCAQGLVRSADGRARAARRDDAEGVLHVLRQTGIRPQNARRPARFP
ncbi:PadR family transcriptional regulator [Cohnella rhizosphaerae]|uniref:PadR family transcriptional regulator n=1 Tax=Cohnella rhizosphaerae TaxID=1457232 RepID=A0A9X4QSC4_9BACL|nr:PadR family transcriptional regulator [Cohnella rhizosphaerae]MDG0809159.1 PadR family transcriptional regulator [Cohnella rhizosphaerae]